MRFKDGTVLSSAFGSGNKKMSWVGLGITSASVVILGGVFYYVVEAIRLTRSDEPEESDARR